MNRFILLSTVAFALLVSSVSAQSTLCTALYPPGSAAASFAGLFAIALIIILAVFVILGIVYAIGYAFKIDKLTSYVKTEIIESTANLALIAIFAGGIGVAFSASVFFSNIGLTGVQSASGLTLLQGTPTTVSSGSQMYSQLCDNYYSRIYPIVVLVAGLYASSMVTSMASSINVELIPNGFGISFHPFMGIDPLTLLLYSMQSIAIYIIIIYLAIIMLTWLIFYLFPIFLYAGILFRSFPWTRAAGGTMLAIFISFYIILPAILYPFSEVTFQPSSTFEIHTIQGLPTSLSAVESFFISPLSPNAAIQAFVPYLADGGLQLFSVIIALLISFDLIESFAELLGAPSLRGQSHKMLRRVI
ncbi:MAG: hypothetical protein QXS71_00980 [Candidatus Micrarchaeaceae archaeon]